MRKRKLFYWMMPLMLLAFVGTAVTFLNPIFNTSTRWLVLGIVIVYLVLAGEFKYFLSSRFGQITLIFILWAFSTVLWSEVPLLSFMKAAAFLAIVFSCMSAGQLWVRYNPLEDAFKYLLPLLAVALAAGFLGRYSTHSIVISGVKIMYQGLVGGPNMFGSMLAMCSPLLIWQTYLNRKSTLWFVIWLLLSGLALNYLLATLSRGAILIVICALLGLLFSINKNRRFKVVLTMLGMFIIGFMAFPGKFENIQQKYIYKHTSAQYNLLYSREDVWRESYEQAKKGGWSGGGYGVTIGDASFEGGLTAIGYGREKGNSQLAIIEETGLVGFAIYIFSLFILFKALIIEQFKLRQKESRVLLGVITGTMFGMVMQSVFEAWWVAPGSPESLYFWTLAGVAMGITREFKRSRIYQSRVSNLARANKVILQEN